jgi:hypothetical protein
LRHIPLASIDRPGLSFKSNVKVKGFQGPRALIVEPDPRAIARAVESTHVPDDEDSPWWRILADLHPKQRAVIADPSPNKCLEKGRRGGGSFVVAAWLLEEFHKWPGRTSMFIALTVEHALSIIWPTLIQLDSKYGLGIRFNAGDHSATLPNGYRILVSGAKDKVQVERMRGKAGGLRRVAIDESGSFIAHDEQFRYMIQSVLRPQFMDTFHLGGGQMIMCGSPGLDPMGFFFEKCTGMTHEGKPVRPWSTHHWTALDNPHVDARGYFIEEIPDHILDDTEPEALVDEILALRELPLSDERWAPVLARLSNQFRREYLADWVRDTASLVYLPDADKNYLPEGWALPQGEAWRVVIGCDIGWGDGNGFAVAAKSLRSRMVVVLEAYYLPELDTSQVADELLMLKAKWRAGEIYVDTGGVGDQRLADLENYGVIAEAAGKGYKKPRIEYVRALLQTGSLKLRPEHCAHVISEWSALPWSEDRQSHREGFVDDVADAVLMAVNPLSQRFLPKGPVRPKPGDPGFERYQADLEKQAAIRKGRRIVRKRRPGLSTEPARVIPMFPARRVPIRRAA